jgi:two-component system cell cycle response regulator
MQEPGDGGGVPVAGAPASSGGHDNRDSHRRRTLKAAKVVLTDWTTIDCTIRDVSAGGAHLVFGDAFALPETFRLLMVSSNTIVPVRLQWQRGRDAGVAFAGPEEPAPARRP